MSPRLISFPRRERPELIDSVDHSDRDFEASFADIARVNRFLGGTSAVLRALGPLVAALPPDSRPVRILDIATGGADIPRAIVRRARLGRFAGRCVQIVATDNHPRVLALARRLTQGYPEIAVAAADALALPYEDGAFDIALCSLAFHHFGPERCVRALGEMERVATGGFIVNDLRRDPVACALIWALTRIVGANRLTRHDAPLSVRRAYTLEEYVAMARRAGIPGFEVRAAPMYRAVLVHSPAKSQKHVR